MGALVQSDSVSNIAPTSSSAVPAVALRHVSMSFEGRSGPVQALSEVNLEIQQREIVSIVGRSGCGKSTLLRIISGLAKSSGGHLSIMGTTTEDYQRHTKFGFVFQEAGLFPWKTVLQNILLPLDIAEIGQPHTRLDRARSLLDMMRLGDFANHYPAQLSGGMRQRISIARAISYEPEILLMDEPFGALDDFTRREIHDELIRIWSRRPMTIILVTHSLPEALHLSDRIVIMAPRPGRVREIVAVLNPRQASGRGQHGENYLAQLDQLEASIHAA